MLGAGGPIGVHGSATGAGGAGVAGGKEGASACLTGTCLSKREIKQSQIILFSNIKLFNLIP